MTRLCVDRKTAAAEIGVSVWTLDQYIADGRLPVVRLPSARHAGELSRRVLMTTELRAVLEGQHAEHEQLKKAGHIFPKGFWRMVADERGGKKHPKAITSFNKVWKLACRAAGCPGRIPMTDTVPTLGEGIHCCE
jgi:hypothetical protein